MISNTLQSTTWLAKRLGLSVSRIERLRARGEGDLPPHITVGLHSIRYDADVVEAWLAEKQHGRMPMPAPATPSATQTHRKHVFGKRLTAGQVLA